ncbi:MAG: EthD family reductase [Sphingomicrobium sp.]
MIILSIINSNAPGARFDWNYYKATHLPLIGRKFGGFGLNSASVLKGVPDADGTEPQATAIALLTFTSMENGRAALNSAEGREVMADLANFTDIMPAIQFSSAVP